MSEDDRVNAVKEWAEPVAKKIINEGYFRIGNHYCIRVDMLELYYNEEAHLLMTRHISLETMQSR